MKIVHAIIISLLFCGALSTPFAILAKTTSTPTPTIDYAADGTNQIQDRLDAINAFSAMYQKDKVYFTDQEKRQIESQYTGLEATFTSIKSNLSKDTGANLATDYNAINNGVYFYEEKLPQLYSEVFLFKAMYLNSKINTMNTSTIPAIIQEIPKDNHEQALSLANDILTISTNMGINVQEINLDYSKLSDAQSKSNAIQTFKSILADIKTNQQTIMADIKTINDDFGKLISLY